MFQFSAAYERIKSDWHTLINEGRSSLDLILNVHILCCVYIYINQPLSSAQFQSTIQFVFLTER